MLARSGIGIGLQMESLMFASKVRVKSTPVTKAQKQAVKLFTSLMTVGANAKTLRSEADIVADIRAVTEYAANIRNVLLQEGDGAGKRIKGNTKDHTFASQADAFLAIALNDNIPTAE